MSGTIRGNRWYKLWQWWYILVAVITGGLIKKARKINIQKIKSGDGSINIQGGENVEASIGENKDE